MRNEITSFRKRGYESLFDVWERFKDLLRHCPHHGIPICIQLETFFFIMDWFLYQGICLMLQVVAHCCQSRMKKVISSLKALLPTLINGRFRELSILLVRRSQLECMKLLKLLLLLLK